MSRSMASAMADSPWPSAKRVRSDAWMLAISSAAPTPLPGDVADEQRDQAGIELEVVEEIAADFARRHRDPLYFGQAEMQRRVRQHVRLNLPAQLELAADALLLDRRALVLLDVGGHAVERRRQPADLVARFHRHARA